MKTKIFILALIYSLLLGPALFAGEKDLNPWRRFFTEPFETVYVIMKDKRVFWRTGTNEIQVNMDTGRLEKELKKEGYEIEDIAIVIHNHLKTCRFSSSDHQRYRRLKKYGFNGRFLVYCHTSKKTYDIEGRKKSK